MGSQTLVERLQAGAGALRALRRCHGAMPAASGRAARLAAHWHVHWHRGRRPSALQAAGGAMVRTCGARAPCGAAWPSAQRGCCRVAAQRSQQAPRKRAPLLAAAAAAGCRFCQHRPCRRSLPAVQEAAAQVHRHGAGGRKGGRRLCAHGEWKRCSPCRPQPTAPPVALPGLPVA